MGNKIYKEIADKAPILASLEKHNPFIVPDGYFSSLEERILDSIDKKPILTSSTPDGYFDNLSEKVMEKIQSEDKVKIIPFHKKRWLSIAASFIIILGAGYLLNTQLNISSKNTEFVFDIEPEEALEYLIENDNLYLSDLFSLDLYEDDFSLEESEMTDLENADLEELLNELDPEDLEELL